MINTNDNSIEKNCNIYMSDWHFAVMILPYINNAINKNIEIITCFENDMTDRIEELVKKLNLKSTEKIRGINWKNSNINNSKSIIKNLLENNKEKLIIINGTNKYIKEINESLKDIIREKNNESKIEILDCYDFNSNKENIKKIVKKYKKIINTSGKNDINKIIN